MKSDQDRVYLEMRQSRRAFQRRGHLSKKKRRTWPWEDLEREFQAKGAARAKAPRWESAE